LVGAFCCVLALLLVACNVYDGDATRSRASNVQAVPDAATECDDLTVTAADAACTQVCQEICNGQDDDCDGRVDERATASCAAPHARAVCSEGACLLARCEEGYRDCDQDASNGCEVVPDAIEHCGRCGRACAVDHGSARCSEGECQIESCAPGYADCDQDGSSCEAELDRDAAHCGSCEHACRFLVDAPRAKAMCSEGHCRSECDAGYGDCDGRFDNGCERSLRTAADCGACGKTCRYDNAQTQCVDGKCEFLACEQGYADCDADSQACERSLSDAASCGGCGRACNFAHAESRCAGDAEKGCEITGCEAGWENCDKALDNGCERDTRPIGSGGLGPCLPDLSCRLLRFAERDYFFCDAQHTWEDSRRLCQLQYGGDLAALPDTATRAFFQEHVQTRVWIGHHAPTVPDVWVWASTNMPFWSGRTFGSTLNGMYTRWARGEPNGSGRCGALTEDAEMDDLACDAEQPFICEVGPDECPEDPNKFHPGQCLCGVSDTDSNQDGFAECPR
jgi:hypothetical protein